MSKVYFDINHICTHSYHSPEEYGAWEESWDFDLGGASLSETDWHGPESYTGETPLQPGDTIYAIVALWSDGDSFGNASHNRFDICVINRDPMFAASNLSILEALDDVTPTTKIWLDTGERISYHAAWTGYFESLDSLELREFTL